MSDDGFHVHGPHDHAVEHVAEHGGHGDKFSGNIAVITAILATVGAMFGYQGGATQNDTALFKNNAALGRRPPLAYGIAAAGIVLGLLAWADIDPLGALMAKAGSAQH